MKATEQYFPVLLFIMVHKVILTFEFLKEILKSDHLNETLLLNKQQLLLIPSKGRFRQYNFCLRLSRAISGVRAARVMQKIAQNSRHSTLRIPTVVVGF